jgi:hypothetical protein
LLSLFELDQGSDGSDGKKEEVVVDDDDEQPTKHAIAPTSSSSRAGKRLKTSMPMRCF